MPPTPQNTDRDIGRHDAQIESLQSEVHALRTDMSRIRDDLSAMRADMAEINDSISRAKGGWQALTIAAGVAMAIGAAAMKFIIWISGNGGSH